MLGGEARALKAPQYEIKGATSHDQDWIDETIAGGVAALDWKPPQPRPPEWDERPVNKQPPFAPATKKPAKKLPFWKRFRKQSSATS